MADLFLRQDSSVFFFGCGPLLEACFEEICSIVGCQPDGLIDSSPTKIGQKFLGYVCESPMALASIEQPIVVVTARKHWPIERAVLAINPKARVFYVVFQSALNKAVRLGAAASKSEIATNLQLNKNFHNKRAVVTGATRGIGELIATRLAEEGFDLVITGRDQESLAHLSRMLRGHGREIIPICADLANEDGLNIFLTHPAVINRPVDLLFNNAGGATPHRSIINQPVEMRDMINLYALNVVSPIAIAEHFFRLSSIEKPLKTVFLTSNLSSPTQTTYTLTKNALYKYVNDCQGVYKQRGANLYLLDPGDVRTPMNPSGAAELKSIFPAALLPLYCKSICGLGVLHASEFSGMTKEDALTAIFFKYNGYWVLDL